MEKSKEFRIGDRIIGKGHPCFIIAEAGVNHNGDEHLAYQMIDAAAAAGADAVKFQSFITDELVTSWAPKAGYQKKSCKGHENQASMLKRLELTFEQHYRLMERCRQKKILYLCTPYDLQSVDALHKMKIAAFKIASTDVTNIPFLKHLAAKGRPIILSTGMSTLGEIEETLMLLWSEGLKDKIALLHCTSDYPAPVNEVNLRAIAKIESMFNCPVGFSDHTLEKETSAWAVAVGACIVEKHFTLDRQLAGPDHKASMEPPELSELIDNIRTLELALGDGIKKPSPSELANKQNMQKSLVAKRKIHKDKIISASDIACKRPGTGLSPSFWDKVIGQVAAADIPADQVLTLGSIKWSTDAG